jgi:hypothetical protein
LVGNTGIILKAANVSSVGHLATGAYCVILNGIDPSTVAAVASAATGGGERDTASVWPTGCTFAGSSGVFVHTWNTATNLNEDHMFSVVIP